MVGAVAGCLSDAGAGEADVIAGPDGRLEFDPAELVVEPGATVQWFFDSSGHNVSGRPADSEEVRLPEGAEAFASYGPEESPRSLVPRGETFDHTFDVPGTHTYVCIPHLGAGMIGRVVVEN
jgi:plastocyanin